jgi:hypothetical protein
MPALLPATFKINLKTVKPNGLAELGVPLVDDTEVKKGKLMEALQGLEGDKVGRRCQNLRATLVKTVEGGQSGVKLIVAFEVFGDDNAPVGPPSAVSVLVHAGDTLVADLPLGSLFLPYGSCWYDNRFSVNLPLEAFTAVDGVSLVAATDEVRAI